MLVALIRLGHFMGVFCEKVFTNSMEIDGVALGVKLLSL